MESFVENVMLKRLDRSPPWFICRVPPQLRSVNEKAYTPKLVSIGPLHHGNKSLELMEETKIRYFQKFIMRQSSACVEIVTEKEEMLRGCYRDSFQGGTLKDEWFVQIIMVDVIFIVELFLENCDRSIDRELDAEWVLNAIGDDLLLLENQLPFFIIEDVWKYATEIPIYWVLYVYFKCQIDSHSNEAFYDYVNNQTDSHSNLDIDDLDRITDHKPKHFVDFVSELCRPSLRILLGREKKDTFQAPSVTDLHRVGVKFKVNQSSKGLFHVSFSKGILEIPKWRINHRTEVVFRNLIAFEQYINFAPEESYTCQYIHLMDCLVNSAEDVDLLIEKKIIEHRLGDSDGVSSMINSLGHGVVISENKSYFAHIFKRLNQHNEKRLNKWIANFKENYLSTPWKTLSLGAAFLLIVLTAIQTVCSIISVTK